MSSPFDKQPSHLDLVQQVAALRDRLAQPLTLADLPLVDLRKQLIENGDPLDLSVLALTGQVPKIRFGAASVTWPGGARLSTALPVLHGLETTPTAVVTCPDWAGPFNHSIVQSPTTTQFTLYGYTTDASLPVLGTTGVHYWLAIG